MVSIFVRNFLIFVLLLTGLVRPSGAAALQDMSVSRVSETPSLMVVELYTSQACPHSPNGDKNLAKLAGRKNILALSFPVTYWDYSGWTDRFAKEIYTERQKKYIAQMPDQWLYTPQIVVQGRIGVNGVDFTAVEQTIDGIAATLDGAVTLLVRKFNNAQEVSVPARDLLERAILTFVAWEPGPLRVEVTSGKNAGKTLEYVNVVRSLVEIGELPAKLATSLLVDIPEEAKGLPCAFLLQDKKTGSILSAAKCQ